MPAKRRHPAKGEKPGKKTGTPGAAKKPNAPQSKPADAKGRAGATKNTPAPDAEKRNSGPVKGKGKKKKK